MKRKLIALLLCAALLAGTLSTGAYAAGAGEAVESPCAYGKWLEDGLNKLAEGLRQWIGLLLQRLGIVTNSHYENVSPELCDPEATQEARRLMAFLAEQYGKTTLSGNYVSPYNDYSRAVFRGGEDGGGGLDARLSNELFVVNRVTGKYPAIIGLDYTNVELPQHGWRDWVTQLAEQYHGLGGIVTLCWHWRIPKNPASLAKDFAYMNANDAAFYTDDITGFDLKATLADPDSRYYAWLMQSVDRLAAELTVLRDAGVPVLWRPLHEASGGWFWWGTDREGYIALYRLLYDKLVNEHGLHNLIWVWNGQNPAWYPGDDVVDMLGDDPYHEDFLDPGFSRRFRSTHRAAPARMVGMSENNKVPDVCAMRLFNTRWQYFVLWDREMILKRAPDAASSPGGDGFAREYLDDYVSEKDLRDTYNHGQVLTLDEMPGWD